MKHEEFECFVQNLARWADSEVNVIAALIVGSWARGTAHAQSDIDVVVICQHPVLYIEQHRGQQRWLTTFGHVQSTLNEDYGLLQVLRAFYRDGMEVEFGFTSEEWLSNAQAKTTGRILRDGMRIVCDRFGRVEKFIETHA